MVSRNRQRNAIKAKRLKEEIDEQIYEMKEDQNLLYYYALLDFRYKLLIDELSITSKSFHEIDSFNTPTDHYLAYYYHYLFKGIHATIIANYKEAQYHFDEAEILLQNVPDELEKADFHYRVSTFYYHTYQPLLAIKYASKAKKIFSKHFGYEKHIALCNNILGLSAVYLKQFIVAEKHFRSAISYLQKKNDKELALFIRHNLAWLYASQNLPKLAIRELTDVVQIPNYFRAIFLKAREHFKLGEVNLTKDLIEKGLNICHHLQNEEYTHHFSILQKRNNHSPLDTLEKTILRAISYFEKEGLFHYVEEYAEILALACYKEKNDKKSSKYFHLAYQARGKKLH